MKNQIARLKYYEANNTFYGHFDTRCLMESQIRELENSNRFLTDEKLKLEVLYKVLIERHSDICKNLASTEKELEILSIKMNDEIGFLDLRLTKLQKDFEEVQKENKSLRTNEEKLRHDLKHSGTEKERYNVKYLKYKSEYQDLVLKMSNVSKDC